MKRIAVTLLISTMTAMTAGCDASDDSARRREQAEAGHRESSGHRPHRGHHGFFAAGDGAIDMQGDVVVIRAGGQDGDAEVSPDGALRIDGDAVELTAEGRSALKAYDAAAVAIRQHAIAVGRAGAEFGIDTLKNVVGGLIDGTVEQAGDKAREGALDLVTNARDLCGRLQAMETAQAAAAAAVAEFRPFAVIDQDQVTECYAELDEARRDQARELGRKLPPEPPQAPEAPSAPELPPAATRG